MSKHREQHDLSDGPSDGLLTDIEYLLDDDEFFKQFEPKKTRQKSKGAKDARRRIEQYWEDRKLAESLSEFYDDTDD